MRRRASLRLGALAAAALGCACGVVFWIPPLPLPCATDQDCVGGAICFQDGCGDPGRDLKVQVTASSQAQEFEVSELRARYDQQLDRPPAFTGAIAQNTSTGPQPFTGSVTFKGIGSALLLPGIPRPIETAVQPSNGVYTLPVSTGHYGALAVYGPDTSLPPVLLENPSSWSLAPGQQQSLAVKFPAQSELVRISGTLLLSLALGPVTTPMQVQVLELTSHRPLSPPAAVDPLTGAFSLLAPPPSSTLTYVDILASPRDATLTTDIIPNRIFSGFPLTSPFPPVVLQLGDFGSTVTLTGIALDSNGQPISGASIFTERQLQERDNFIGPTTLSGPDGTFAVKSLPSLTAQDAVTIWIVPPPGPAAGTYQATTIVPLTGGSVGPLQCPKRVPVVGVVLRPAGDAPASGVGVHAEPVAGVDGRKSPTFSQDTTTDTEGRFSFFADPGVYRLDFHPADNLPRVSRRVTVPVPVGTADPAPVEVPTFTLFNARTLSGTITGFASPTAATPTPLPGATVELFRVAQEDGKSVSYSLGRATTDPSGAYTMVIPAAAAPADGGTPDAGGP